MRLALSGACFRGYPHLLCALSGEVVVRLSQEHDVVTCLFFCCSSLTLSGVVSRGGCERWLLPAGAFLRYRLVCAMVEWCCSLGSSCGVNTLMSRVSQQILSYRWRGSVLSLPS